MADGADHYDYLQLIETPNSNQDDSVIGQVLSEVTRILVHL